MGLHRLILIQHLLGGVANYIRLRLRLLLGDDLHLGLDIGLGTRHSEIGLLLVELLRGLDDLDALPLVLLGHGLGSLLEQVHSGSPRLLLGLQASTK